MKEKVLVERTEDGGTVFQGEVMAGPGRTVLDRTRLIPLEDGGVRQIIETSADGGARWRKQFDAKYIRRGADRSE